MKTKAVAVMGSEGLECAGDLGHASLFTSTASYRLFAGRKMDKDHQRSKSDNVGKEKNTRTLQTQLPQD